MNVEDDTDMTMHFDVAPEKAHAVKYLEIETEIQTDVESEPAEIRKDGENYVLSGAQKGYRYQIQAEWENGQVEYGFVVK